jgi:hypothetical protein
MRIYRVLVVLISTLTPAIAWASDPGHPAGWFLIGFMLGGAASLVLLAPSAAIALLANRFGLLKSRLLPHLVPLGAAAYFIARFNASELLSSFGFGALVAWLGVWGIYGFALKRIWSTQDAAA